MTDKTSKTAAEVRNTPTKPVGEFRHITDKIDREIDEWASYGLTHVVNPWTGLGLPNLARAYLKEYYRNLGYFVGHTDHEGASFDYISWAEKEPFKKS